MILLPSPELESSNDAIRVAVHVLLIHPRDLDFLDPLGLPARKVQFEVKRRSQFGHKRIESLGWYPDSMATEMSHGADQLLPLGFCHHRGIR